MVAGLATKRDPTVTPPHRFDHTLVCGEILLLFGRSDDEAGRKGIFPGNFRRLKAVKPLQKKGPKYTPFYYSTLWPFGGMLAQEEKRGRAGARMDGIGRRRMALALDEEERLSRTDLRL